MWVVDAEVHHEPIASSGADASVESCDGLAADVVITDDDVAESLGVERSCQRCRSHEVDRHQGDWPSAVESGTEAGPFRFGADASHSGPTNQPVVGRSELLDASAAGLGLAV